MFELTINGHFSAAHRLKDYEGPCERLHGHNWRVRVTVSSEELDDADMVIDFRSLKEILGEVLDEYDHAFLNELPRFRESNSTTENIARCIAEETQLLLTERTAGVRVLAVTCWETDGCSATYRT